MIESLFRYPIKSMRGERVTAIALGWDGLVGDRQLGVRRKHDRSDFPWLSATKVPDLCRFTPEGEDGPAELPTHVRTCDGARFPLYSDELADDLARRCGEPVEVMRLRHGIFDDAPVSLITTTTVGELCRLGGVADEVQRFRTNVVIRSQRAVPFEENDWVGATIRFGTGDDAASVAIAMCSVRCAVINNDPTGGPMTPALLKAAVRANDNNAGVAATVTRTGRLEVGMPILLDRGR